MFATIPSERLRTVHLVPLTAFDESGRLALAPMRASTQRLLDAGVRVFIPCAGSAEFDSLSADEIAAAVAMTREVVGPAAIVQAPIGRRLDEAIEIGRKCLAAGADAVLVMPLAFAYLADEGARDYYRAILAALDCPTLIYKKADIPSDRLLLELAGDERVVGVKYAVNDVDAFSRTVQADGGSLEWICGSAERFAPYFALAGASGYTSGAGNLCPRLTLAMHAALAEGRWLEALRLQQIIRPIEDYRARAGSSYNISMLKHALGRLGLDFGRPRAPQRQLTGQERAEIEALVVPILEAEEALDEKALDVVPASD